MRRSAAEEEEGAELNEEGVADRITVAARRGEPLKERQKEA